MLAPRHLVLTDLDGTLLDHHTYSWAAAAEALGELEHRGIPWVIVTSKTRAEVEVLREKMGHGHPFITENGGGIYVPSGYFPIHVKGSERVGRYQCVRLGKPYTEVVEALDDAAAEAGVSVVGFHSMTPREIAQNTGLSQGEAEHARLREYDEPFFFAGASDAQIARFVGVVKKRGFEARRGGRFWHLVGGCDKGRAVRMLLKFYREALRAGFRTIGLGDSANDLAMLAAVNQPVLLPQPDVEFSSEVLECLPRVVRGAFPGPKGWNVAVLEFIGSRRGARKVMAESSKRFR